MPTTTTTTTPAAAAYNNSHVCTLECVHVCNPTNHQCVLIAKLFVQIRFEDDVSLLKIHMLCVVYGYREMNGSIIYIY